jgi:uncharacterized protein YndB with AHSA1/START domain
MTVVRTTPDPETRTLTVVAELAAPPARVWQLWADPRQLERWWGPPTWPASFVEHNLAPGGRSRYFMTGPDGEKAHGWWRFQAVEEPRSLELEDGFADENGVPTAELPTISMRMDLEEVDAGTRMTLTSRFASLEQMEQLMNMGMIEGLTEALGQIDELLVAA